MAEGDGDGDDWSDYVSSDSETGGDPYIDDPKWTEECAYACDVAGSIGWYVLVLLSKCLLFMH
jgi:hypothetical protein